MYPTQLNPEATLQRLLSQLDNLRQTELRATSMRIASLVGHLVGTPLNVIVGRAALIRADPSPEAATRNARRIEEQVVKLAGRIRNLLEYLTPTDERSDGLTLRQVASDALALYGPIAAQSGVHLDSVEVPGELGSVTDGCLSDGHAALVVVTALVSLAIRVAPPGGRLELRYARIGHVALFDLPMPGLAIPRGSIDAIEPVDDPDPGGRIHWRVLSVCSSLAARLGGHLKLESVEGVCNVRLSCPLARFPSVDS
jgi:signal transduction histidine kinase